MTRGPPDSDVVCDLLANERRRRALAVLGASGRRLTVHDLTWAIAIEEAGPRITDVPGQTVREVFVTLQHVHLPKLAALELIEYDQERGLVDPTDRLAGLESTLSVVTDADFESTPRLEVAEPR